ncbi:uncharacterized protein LOC135846533 [Planococcus citri]|uniref:uncharacterized protein LOC135846533 n=1 Tax=Planococcus citri TaxID=170843 RepID=UPI0031F7B49D
MALVMLPCDMPWWATLQTHIEKLASAQNADQLISGMQTIHTMCNVGLDPDEPDGLDPEVLKGLKKFVSFDLTDSERDHFFTKTLPIVIDSALRLKHVRPTQGLRFSLQQEISTIEVKHNFACSLIAHAFLSTFPKRTHKTHPTLQDFNFSHFFRHLNENFQKSKLRSLFHYFDLQHEIENDTDQIKLTRQVMKGTDWLTIEDWLESESPLCPLVIKHDNRMENAEFSNSVNVCFSSKKPGGRVLGDGTSTECVQFITCPELLITLLCVEALEDNEVLLVENLFKVSRINNLRVKGEFEPFQKVVKCNVCCMDAENYARLPLSQYEEDNVLRELNKAALGFKLKREYIILRHAALHQPIGKRLSPIGESYSMTPTENSSSTNTQVRKKERPKPLSLCYFKRNKFIVLGSSGEHLPVSRVQRNSEYSSCGGSQEDSSSDEYYSARASVPEYECASDEEEMARRYSCQLDTPENRNSFAERLREALCRAQSSSSTDSSYAVDISVTGSSIADPNIRMKRGGSRGFMLEEDSFDQRDNQNMETSQRNSFNGQNLPNNPTFDKNEGDSSKYSFSTDSDIEEVYEQLTRWLDESEEKPSLTGTNLQQQKIRHNTVMQFAGSLLKRTLSESFVGVPLTEGGDGDEALNEPELNGKTVKKIKMAVRSLSLELAKHKNKFVGHLNSVDEDEGIKGDNGFTTVITGNWGCGSSNLGDPQLKLLVQWIAASIVGTPQLVYYTCNHRKLLKLDTVSRVLIDRRWNVKELAQAVIHLTQYMLSQSETTPNDECNTLFDLLINSNSDKCTNLTKRKTTINT